MQELVTKRLRLRPAEDRDLGDLHAVFSDPDAMRYWSTPPHGDISQTEAFLSDMKSAARGTGLEFVLDLDGRVIGKAGVFRPPEIGYILHPDFWGKGLAREALEALVQAAFSRPAIAELVADVDPRNTRSIGLLTALGFRERNREANTLFVNGEWCDSVYLVLRRDPDTATPR